MENLLIDFYTGKRIFNIFKTNNVLSHLIQGRVIRGEIDSAVGGLHCQAQQKRNIYRLVHINSSLSKIKGEYDHFEKKKPASTAISKKSLEKKKREEKNKYKYSNMFVQPSIDYLCENKMFYYFLKIVARKNNVFDVSCDNIVYIRDIGIDDREIFGYSRTIELLKKVRDKLRIKYNSNYLYLRDHSEILMLDDISEINRVTVCLKGTINQIDYLSYITNRFRDPKCLLSINCKIEMIDSELEDKILEIKNLDTLNISATEYHHKKKLIDKIGINRLRIKKVVSIGTQPFFIPNKYLELEDIKQIYSNKNNSAFAALNEEGDVFTWGDAEYGGVKAILWRVKAGEWREPRKINISVRKQLKNVKHIYSTNKAFAALTVSGQVVTWGDAVWGGDSSRIQAELKDQVVEEIYSTGYAFAALLADGRVVTWGNARSGGDSSRVQAELKDVKKIYSNDYAFAALSASGRVVTWGDAPAHPSTNSISFKDEDQVRDILERVAHLPSEKANEILASAFVKSLLPANAPTGSRGDSSSVQAKLKDQVVEKIYSTRLAFAALLKNGQVVTWVVTWGSSYSGGKIPDDVKNELKDRVVQRIYSTRYAFAAVSASGQVVTWGNARSGGDSSSVQAELKDVKKIYSTAKAFAALTESGQVVTWGRADSGGDSSSVQAELKKQKVKHIYSTRTAFAALTESGQVVTWGNTGDNEKHKNNDWLQAELEGKTIKKIYSNDYGFVLLTHENKVIVWGKQIMDDEQDVVNSYIINKIYPTTTRFICFVEEDLTRPEVEDDGEKKVLITSISEHIAALPQEQARDILGRVSALMQSLLPPDANNAAAGEELTRLEIEDDNADDDNADDDNVDDDNDIDDDNVDDDDNEEDDDELPEYSPQLIRS
jgi:hypothetical protein